MRASIICYLVLASAVPFLNVEASLAQELSVEDRACITSAVAKLPQVAALKIEGSRAIEGRILEQPQSQGRHKWNVYRVKVEIDVTVAGQRSTYVFNCIHSGQHFRKFPASTALPARFCKNGPAGVLFRLAPINFNL
jgi:hypothetical protein